MTQEALNQLVASLPQIDFVNTDKDGILGTKFFNFEGDLAQIKEVSEDGVVFEVYGDNQTFTYTNSYGEEPQVGANTSKGKIVDGVVSPELEAELNAATGVSESYDISNLGFSAGKEITIKSWDDFESNFKSYAKTKVFEPLPMWFNDGGVITVKVNKVDADTLSGLQVTVEMKDGTSQLNIHDAINKQIRYFFEEEADMPQILNEAEGEVVATDGPEFYDLDQLTNIRTSMQGSLTPMEFEEFLADWEATEQSMADVWPQKHVIDALLARHNTSAEIINEEAVYATPSNTPSGDVSPAPFVADYIRSTETGLSKTELEKNKYYKVNEEIVQYKGSRLGGEHNTTRIYEFLSLDGKKSECVSESIKSIKTNPIFEGLGEMPFSTFCEITKSANVYESLGQRVSTVTGPARQALELERSLKSNYISNLSMGYNLGALKSVFESMKLNMPVKVYEAPTRPGEKPAAEPAKSSPEKDAIKEKIKVALEKIKGELDAKTEEIKIHMDAIKEAYADKYAQLKANKDSRVKALEGNADVAGEREKIVKDYTDKKEQLQLQELNDLRAEKQKIADLETKAAQLQVKIKMQDPDLTPEKKTELEQWLANRKKEIADQMIDFGKTVDTVKDKAYSLIGESLKKQPRKLNESAAAGFAYDAKTICEAVMGVAKSIGMGKMSLGDLCEMLKSEFNVNDLSESLIASVEEGLKSAGMNIVYDVNEAKSKRRKTKDGRKPVRIDESAAVRTSETVDSEDNKVSSLQDFLDVMASKGQYTEHTETPSKTLFKVGDKVVGEWNEFDNYGRVYESRKDATANPFTKEFIDLKTYDQITAKYNSLMKAASELEKQDIADAQADAMDALVDDGKTSDLKKANESVDTSEYAKFQQYRDFTSLCKALNIDDINKAKIMEVLERPISDKEAYEGVAEILGDQQIAKDILIWWGGELEDSSEDITEEELMKEHGIEKSFKQLCAEWDIADDIRNKISTMVGKNLEDPKANPERGIIEEIKKLVPSPGAQADIIKWWKLSMNESEGEDSTVRMVKHALDTASGMGKNKRNLGHKISSALYSTIRGTAQAKEYEWNPDEQLYLKKEPKPTNINEGKLKSYYDVATEKGIDGLTAIEKGDNEPIKELFTFNKDGKNVRVYTSVDNDEVTVEIGDDDDDMDIDGFKQYLGAVNTSESKIESSITRGGSALWPETLEVKEGEVIWTKRNTNFLSKNEVTIPLDKIAGINHKNKLIGSDITISSSGGEVIKAEGFVTDELLKLMKEMKTSAVINESVEDNEDGINYSVGDDQYDAKNLATIKELYSNETSFVEAFESKKGLSAEDKKKLSAYYNKGK